MAEPSRYPGTPRWVKVFGLIVGVLALLFVVAHLTGHGMGHHGGSGDQPSPVGL